MFFNEVAVIGGHEDAPHLEPQCAVANGELRVDIVNSCAETCELLRRVTDCGGNLGINIPTTKINGKPDGDSIN